MIISKVNNSLRIVLFLAFLLTANEFFYCQKAKIEKIIDSNLFELDDGTLIKIANIDVPNINHPNLSLRKVGLKAFEYARQIFLKRSYELTYPNPVKSDTIYRLVYLIKEYPLELRDYTQTYLQKGYGKYINNTNNFVEKEKYLIAENEARDNKKGIWQYNFSNSDTLDRSYLGEELLTEEIYDSLRASGSIFSGLESGERVLIEMVAAPVLGFASAFLSGALVGGIAGISGSDNMNNLGYFIVGAYVGYAIGNAAGVYSIAKSGDREITYGETFLASAFGGVLGILGAYMNESIFNNAETRFVFPLALPGLCAIIYANIIAPKKVDNKSYSNNINNSFSKNNFMLSHKDIFNSKKIFEMEVLKISF